MLLRDFADYGLAKEDQQKIEEMSSHSNGLILVTGPTGSGKTTTLYASLAEIDNEARNVITIEDPVEYKLAGYSQIEIKPKLGLNFANALRSVLRQDPDVIMVGEMRDPETAQTARQLSHPTGRVASGRNGYPDACGAFKDEYIENR